MTLKNPSIHRILHPLTLISISLLSGCGGGGGGSAILSPIEAPESTPKDVETQQSGSAENTATTDNNDITIATPNNPVEGSTTSDSMKANDEYAMSWGLEAINASALYDIGGTGKGQIVAVVDTGIDGSHQELQGRLLADSYDFQNDTSEMTDDSNHGTHIAGIIAGAKDGEGNHGIAFESEILGIGLLGDNYLSFQDIAATYQYAIDRNAKVINNSWGVSGINIDSFEKDKLEQLFGNNIIHTAAEAGANDDTVFVWSAGNDNGEEVNVLAGLPYYFPELKEGWVAVVAINQSGEIAGYSNHCGKAKEWCLAAPGSSILSAASGGGYMASSGASSATAHVSGGLAAMKSAFPTLTNQQILARILHTANKSGIYADSEIYGNGLLDLDAASSPIGSLKMSNADSATDDAALASSSVVVLPKSLLSGLDMDANTNVLLLDSFQNAPFWASASQYIKEQRAPVLDIEWSSLFSVADNGTSQAMSLGGDYSLSFNLNSATKSVEGFNLKSSDDDSTFSFGSGSGSAISENVLSFSHAPDWLSASADGYIASGYELKQLGGKDNMRVNLGVASKNSLAGKTSSNSLIKSTAGDVGSAVMAEMAMSVGDSTELSMQLGAGVIDNINSQTSASGAFAMNRSELSNIGLGLTQQVGKGLLSASLDYANIATTNNNSLIELPDQIGLTTAKVDYRLTDGGRHGLKMGAAMRKASGDDINVRLPSSIGSDGAIGYASYNADVGNLYDQKSLEMTYNYLVNSSTTVGVQSYYQQQGESFEDFGIIFGVEIADR